MVYGIRVPRSVGRAIKGLLKKKRYYEDKYLPEKTKDYIVFPLRSKHIRCTSAIHRITNDYHIDSFDLRENRRTRSFRRELQKILPQKIYNRAARAYEQIGDIGIITVFSEMEDYENEIANALMETNKGVRLVLKKLSKYSGKQRLQEFKKLAGTGKPETIHTENGVSMQLDVTRVYFSARTANERKRIASCIREEEDVLVLFSGCAPYPLVIAKNTPAHRVVGVESNKLAHGYAEQNVRSNGLHNILLMHDDARKAIGKLDGSFDRIIMPHPTEADYYVKDALSVLKKKGVVHMYLFSKPEKLDYAQKKIEQISARQGWFVKKINIVEQLHVSSEVKKYCFDIFY